mgnify:CR=1 FL=1
MSLFMVPDEATQELMSRFYENWINKGMDLRQAFSEAKKELKKKLKLMLKILSITQIQLGFVSLQN